MTNPQTEPIPVNQPFLGDLERRYVNQALDDGWISSEGPFVAELEERFAARVGRSHGVAVSSGSAALEVALASLGIGPQDEVVMPTLTIISCAAPIVRSGGLPVLVDSDSLTWNMDVTDVEEKITDRTKAIMAVHLYGLPVDLDPLLEVAERRGIPVIEDAAQMHGQTYRGKPCGTFGAVSVFSFYPNKLITTGEGGMIVADDADLAERCRLLRNLAFLPDGPRFVHHELGWNYRMSNLQAALGLAQLERLDDFVARKRRMGRLYTELLQDVDGLQLSLASTEYADSIYWAYGVVLNDEVSFDAVEAMRRLGERGIGTRPFFFPMHEQPAFRKMGLFEGEQYPVAERLARRGFYLPSSIGITDGQLSAVAGTVRQVLL